jgi:hypothetical protein
MTNCGKKCMVTKGARGKNLGETGDIIYEQPLNQFLQLVPTLDWRINGMCCLDTMAGNYNFFQQLCGLFLSLIIRIVFKFVTKHNKIQFYPLGDIQ